VRFGALRNENINPVIVFDGQWTACSLGIGLDVFWDATLKARSSFSSAANFIPKTSSDSLVAGILALGANPESYYDRGAKLGEMLARQINPLANKILSQVGRSRSRIYIATSHGDPGPAGVYTESLLAGSIDKLDMSRLLRDQFVTKFEEFLPKELRVTVVSAACASGIIAMSIAEQEIRSRRIDFGLVISQDVLSRVAFEGFKLAGAMSKSICRPFDAERDGINVAEGAVIFGVATPNFAEKFGGSVAEILGSASYCDGKGMVEPSSAGLASAVKCSLERARCDPGEVSAIYWHGTGTIQNDLTESKVANEIFGLLVPPGTSTKGSIGHTMGASSAFNVLAACRTISSKQFPGVAGLQNSDFPELNISATSRQLDESKKILISALGFGGINAAVLLGALT
jgi:3-oxoacyl-[acyl-carrier-protein] synthase II